MQTLTNKAIKVLQKTTTNKAIKINKPKEMQQLKTVKLVFKIPPSLKLPTFVLIDQHAC